MLACPLCKSEQLKIAHTFPVNDIDALYKQLYNTPVKHLFKGRENLDLVDCMHCNLRFYDPEAAGDEAFYNALQHYNWYYMDDKPEFHYALKHIKASDKVLEVGSGKGAFAQLVKCASYTGLDFSKKAKEMAALKGITILNEDIVDHALENKEKYDVVCSFQVVEHVTDVRGFLQAKTDALKPGGLLIFAVPSENSYISKSFNLALNLPPHHITRWKNEAMHAVGNIFGLETVTVHHDPLSPMHYFDYAFQVYQHSIYKICGVKYEPLTMGFFNKFAKAIAYFPALLFAKGLRPEIVPISHTVVGVYRKSL